MITIVKPFTAEGNYWQRVLFANKQLSKSKKTTTDNELRDNFFYGNTLPGIGVVKRTKTMFGRSSSKRNAGIG
jgi:hypothetical protein